MSRAVDIWQVGARDFFSVRSLAKALDETSEDMLEAVAATAQDVSMALADGAVRRCRVLDGELRASIVVLPGLQANAPYGGIDKQARGSKPGPSVTTRNEAAARKITAEAVAKDGFLATVGSNSPYVLVYEYGRRDYMFTKSLSEVVKG